MWRYGSAIMKGLESMENDTKYKMSEELLEELKKQYQELSTVKVREIAEQIKEARSFGDLSENSEYDEAKTEQGKLYSKISELKDLIDNAVIVQTSDSTEVVGIGRRVTVRNLATGAEEEFQIVGSQESDPFNGRISDISPLGKGLTGLAVGENADIDAPSGTVHYEIMQIN
jgi:transcription elongation factor GreA